VESGKHRLISSSVLGRRPDAHHCELGRVSRRRRRHSSSTRSRRVAFEISNFWKTQPYAFVISNALFHRQIHLTKINVNTYVRHGKNLSYAATALSIRFFCSLLRCTQNFVFEVTLRRLPSFLVVLARPRRLVSPLIPINIEFNK
jgi:hypothetical protein